MVALSRVRTLDQPLKCVVFGHQFTVAFAPHRVEWNAFHGTNDLALRPVEVSDALSALAGIDLVDLKPHRDGGVRALGFAHVAVDALVGDHQGHELFREAMRIESFIRRPA